MTISKNTKKNYESIYRSLININKCLSRRGLRQEEDRGGAVIRVADDAAARLAV